ncbi:helix-turn-helix domain-containing protein [Collinsella tanakaei]|uniref:helix-turn-helix domain-containing protein n=2 Tax=Collinsella tanakaei TaxID=626935 RepID=UPI001F1FF65A|nr:helix-turn-helix transcriptional regulator [Collinsella tanakaei]MCF2621274.1 helix-turn-helix transcriptional regulator [Collinsella tanakaei]MDM8301600.1 helix-turn-helix transcriptional regulator [Collinsella tanakaei]
MPIVMRLDRMMADRKMSSLELAEKIGISPVNVSRIKTGRLKGIRFSTLTAMCEALHCKPGDIIDWMDDDEYVEAFGSLPGEED